MANIELEWLGEEGIDIHALVSGTPITPLVSSMSSSEVLILPVNYEPMQTCNVHTLYINRCVHNRLGSQNKQFEGVHRPA